MNVLRPSAPSREGRASPDLLFRQAAAAQMRGEIGRAASLYQRILQSSPGHRGALNNLGAIHLYNREWEAAIRLFQEIVEQDPRNSDAWNNLGVACLEMGDAPEALSCFRKAKGESPGDAEILTNMGAAYERLGDLDSACSCHRKAVEMDPAGPKGYNNLALALKRRGDIGAAVSLLQKALELQPQEERFSFNLCEALVEKGDLPQAVSLCERTLGENPGSITTAVGAARVFIQCGHWEKADPLIRKASAYPFTGADLGLLRHLLLYLNGSALPRETIARLHHLAGGLLFENASRHREKTPFLFSEFDSLKKARVGYVSPDFRRHSVGWFFREILESHDRSRFDIYCYSLSDRSDDLTGWMEGRSTVFRRVAGMPDAQVARQIFEDRIMVLVDLAGYTSENRLEIFARRPAPVQVTAVGYPHGTGLPTMDYRITDHASEGVSVEEEYREKLLRLGRFFLPLPAFASEAPYVSRASLGIRQDEVAFASFNSFHKLRPEVLQLWDRILLESPGSHLLFSFKHSSSEYARGRIMDHLHLPQSRVHFLGETRTEEEHRGRYALADLALDPFPYSGTTTSWEALSMGVPVITLRGERHVGRTTFGLLSHLGLQELAADTADEYRQIAKTLASDPERRNRLRETLRSRIQAVTERGNRPYVEQLEALYLSAWSRYRKGETTPPALPLS